MLNDTQVCVCVCAYLYIYIYINKPTVLSLHYNEIVHVWGFVGANRPVRLDPTGQRPTLAASEGAERGRASPPFSLGTGPPALAQTPRRTREPAFPKDLQSRQGGLTQILGHQEP